MAAVAGNGTALAENHSHHSLFPSCCSSDSACSARKAPEPSRGEGFDVLARRPRIDFMVGGVSHTTLDFARARSNRLVVQAALRRNCPAVQEGRIGGRPPLLPLAASPAA